MPIKVGEQAVTPNTKRRNGSLGFFTSIFKRRKDESDSVDSVQQVQEGMLPMETATAEDAIVEGQNKINDMHQDLHKLHVSRQDNPFLQRVQASTEELALVAGDVADTSRLASLEPPRSRELALAEVHAHLVRSPPPTGWPRAHHFDFSLGDPGGVVEVLPSPNLRPIVPKTRGQVMDQSMLDILQHQRTLPLRASSVDESFTGRLSPRQTTPPRPPAAIAAVSPKKAAPTETVGGLLLPAVAGFGDAAPAEARLTTPLAPVRDPRRPATQGDVSRLAGGPLHLPRRSISTVEDRPST